jgi:hypothetical protein
MRTTLTFEGRTVSIEESLLEVVVAAKKEHMLPMSLEDVIKMIDPLGTRWHYIDAAIDRLSDELAASTNAALSFNTCPKVLVVLPSKFSPENPDALLVDFYEPLGSYEFYAAVFVRRPRSSVEWQWVHNSVVPKLIPDAVAYLGHRTYSPKQLKTLASLMIGQ